MGTRAVVGVLLVVAVVVAGAACGDGGRSSDDDATPAPPGADTPSAELYVGVEPPTTATGDTVEGSLRTPDGRERTYRVYVPSSLPTTEPAPLLIALHGGLGSASQFQASSGFDEVAEANGFLVVYPDGSGLGRDGARMRTWNGGYCCGRSARDAVDDVGFIALLLDAVAEKFEVDPARTYAAGHSNGGIMSYRLACELSDRIVAVGVQAASLGVDVCAGDAPVSLLHLHGTADDNHPIDGGEGSGVAGVDFRPAVDGLESVAAADGCDDGPVDARVESNPDLTVTAWGGCAPGVAVELVAVEGATHAWMGHGSGSSVAEQMVGEPYADLDASLAIWAFLAAHPRS